MGCSTVSPVVDRVTGTTIEQRCEKDYVPALAFWNATAKQRTLSSTEEFAKASVEAMVTTYCIPKIGATTPPVVDGVVVPPPAAKPATPAPTS